MIVTWRGNEVGVFEPGHPDMWYLDGELSLNGSAHAAEFGELAGALDYKSVLEEPQRGTRVLLTEEEDGSPVSALVLALKDGQLSVRMVLMPDAIT